LKPISTAALSREQDVLAADSAGLIADTGHRVRAFRNEAGWSRRELSERSGVSQRYLAQLESGDGNVSLTVLYRLSVALNKEPQQLISEQPAIEQELLQAFRNASATRQKQAMDLLHQTQAARRFCVIGLRGAGKSTLGAYAAEHCGLRFIELNDHIETLAGMPVNEVMALYEQDGYRRFERTAIEALLDEPDILIAAAGGIVSDDGCWQLLQRHFTTIWIKARPEEHMQRVLDQGDNRPMANNPAAMDQLRELLRQREGRYAEANITIDSSNRTIEDCRQLLVNAVRDELQS